MFGLTFANPLLWAGVFAVGIPIAIHLLTRKTPVWIIFPTIRFLQRAKASQSRVYRIRHWLMLALRTLAIALLVLAFLRPEYRARALVSSPRDESGHAVVILIDTSLSMRHTRAGFSPFAQARVVAEQLLEGLGSTDVASVIFMGSSPEPVFNEFQAGIGGLVEAVHEHEAGYARADIDAAIALALKQLETEPERQGELHLVSDFQRTNWAAVNFAVIPESVQTVFESVGESDRENTAVTEIEVTPPYAAVGEAVRIQVEVANYSGQPREIPVRLFFNDRELPVAPIRLEPRLSGSVQVRVDITEPGSFEGRAEIPGDALSPDDTRYFTVHATNRIPVILLTNRPPNDSSAAYRFVRAALDPLGGRNTTFEPRVMVPGAFSRSNAGTAQIVVAVEPGPFSESTAESLIQFLRDGGGVIYFLSEPSDAANLGLLTEKAEGDLTLPFTVGGLMDIAENPDQPFAVLHQANYDHPILRKFRETGALAELQFYRYFATQRQEAKGQVLLQFDNGNIALANKTLGVGTLLLVNMAVDSDGSNLPKTPIFVPLLHEMVREMRPTGGGAHAFLVGGAASATVRLPAPDAPIRFTNPAGTEINAGLDISGTEGSVILTETSEPGHYRVYSESQRLASVPVNIDPRESDLSALTVDQLRELARLAHQRFLREAGTNPEALRRLREGLPLWHYLLILALCGLAIEQLLAWRWKR